MATVRVAATNTTTLSPPVGNGKPSIPVVAVAVVVNLPKPTVSSRLRFGWYASQSRPRDHQRYHRVRAASGTVGTPPSRHRAATEASGGSVRHRLALPLRPLARDSAVEITFRPGSGIGFLIPLRPAT